MKLLLQGGKVFTDGRFEVKDILIIDGRIAGVESRIPYEEGALVVDASGKHIVPAFADVHVHLREPGFSYKETIETGTQAAARGGYSLVCPMPNLDPVPDSTEHLAAQLFLIEDTAVVKAIPYGTITVGEKGEELADLAGMANSVVGFSDDGRGVQSDDMMRLAMTEAAKLGKPIVAHCEVNELLRGGYIHDGKYAREHGHAGICSESEWHQVERDINLVRETGCQYHVCHVSTKESVELVRRAKAEGLPVSCETAPHYLVLHDALLQEEGCFKMNPPLRDISDREALIEGIKDGTVEVIATDHAPHSAEEKSKGLKGSAFGIVGLETSFPVLYTELVLKNIITLEKLIELMSLSPRRIFGLDGGRIEEGQPADIAILDLDAEYTIDPADFASKGGSTPFEGWKVRGKAAMTIVEGNIVYGDTE